MKTRLLSLVVGGTLLPLSQVHAKTYGGFPPGKEFMLKVTEKESTRTKGDRVAHDVAIPDSMPDFEIGQTVNFTIGSRGQLTGPGFSIAYEGFRSRLNLYSNNPSFSRPSGQGATVTKSSSGEPTGATLTFYKFRFSGFIPITTTVSYVLD